MPTYYDELKISPSASEVEIETAWSGLYGQWRRLVTHHDPNIANQATSALTQLDTIRSTLLDPAKRSIYDSALGLGPTVGGLADPSAVLKSVATPGSPTPHTRDLPSDTQSPVSPWSCPTPTCRTDNPVGTRFCLNCGTQIVRACPECGQVASMVRTGRCGQCGFAFDTAQLRAELVRQIQQLDQDIQARDAGVLELHQRKQHTEAHALREHVRGLQIEQARLRAEHARLDPRIDPSSISDYYEPPVTPTRILPDGGQLCGQCGYVSSSNRRSCKQCHAPL